jgi:hypothetical protein
VYLFRCYNDRILISSGSDHQIKAAQKESFIPEAVNWAAPAVPGGAVKKGMKRVEGHPAAREPQEGAGPSG